MASSSAENWSGTPSYGQGAVPVFINDSDGHYIVGSKLDYLEDPQSILQLQDILDTPDSSFQTSDHDTLNFGFTDSSYWLRFRINADNVKSTHQWLIQIAFPTINELDLYVIDEAEASNTWGNSLTDYQEYHTGTNYPFDTKPIPHRHFLFPLDLKNGDEKIIVMRVKATNALQVPVSIWEQQAFDHQELYSLLGWGGFFGMIVMMTLYNLFIYLFVQDRSYLYYIFYINSVMVVVLGLNGIGYQIFWPNNPEWSRLSISLFPGSLVFFATQFGRHFLETKRYAPLLDKLLLMLNFAAILLGVLSFSLPQTDFTPAATTLVFTFAILTLTSGVYCLKQSVRSASYYLTAWMLFLAGLFLYTLSLYAILPSMLITNHAKEFGAAIEMMLLSLGLADRINREKKEKIRALESQNEAIRGMKLAERRLYHKALHDDLTNLPNRKLLQREMPLIIDSALKESNKLAVIIVRFNRLLEIYNTLGPASKETLYKLAATRLSEIMSDFNAAIPLELLEQQQQQIIALDDRSFAVIFELDHQELKNCDIKTLLGNQLHIINQPFQHRGMSISLDCSIGIAFVPEHGLDIDSLLQHADVAVEAASLRQPQIMVYSPSIDPYSAKRLSLMGELRDAINENRLLIEFQPQLDLKSNSIVAAEALLRWYHPAHGHIPPEDTLRMAEQSGLLKPLTHWILNTTLKHAKVFLHHYPNLKICMNISSKNLREPDLIDEITKGLVAYQIPPNSLNIEITENDMMEDPELALNILTRLANKGVHISIDDFGTGYSSLSYLSALPVHELKIDKNFIQAMQQYDKQRAIVLATINMGRDLGLNVVAEGVENLDTLNYLRNTNCHLAQGFFVGRPIPGHQFTDWMNQSKYKPRIPAQVHAIATPTIIDDLLAP